MIDEVESNKTVNIGDADPWLNSKQLRKNWSSVRSAS